MLNIIVVDDEVPIREWIVYSLNKLKKPFNIVGVAASGQEAYELVVKYKPDVVLTDIKMPGMDGIELMQAVKNISPYTLFIVLTNYADFTYAKQALTYGAREYLLKSEMRGEDIGIALDKILEEKRSITQQKKRDILSSGYVDLYGLYKSYEKEHHGKQFWSQYNMSDNVPYSVLALQKDPSYQQREFLLEILDEVAPRFFITAIRHDVIYLILQEIQAEVLELEINQVINKIVAVQACCIAKSRVHTSLEESTVAIEEAQQVLGYTFFKEQKQLSYLALCEHTRLNRHDVREEYHKILGDLSLKLYDQTKQGIKKWFEKMQSVHIEDVAWAKEMCQRMVISVEERFYQLNLQKEEDRFTQVNTCIRQCQNQCEKMIDTMMGDEGLVSTKPIKVALHFIHENYNKNISLTEVAQSIFLSAEYFSRLFKEEVGENFSVYLMMYRLKRAKELLVSTDLRVAEIANEVGYGTPGYFSRIYKKYMGKSPDEEKNGKKSNDILGDDKIVL